MAIHSPTLCQFRNENPSAFWGGASLVSALALGAIALGAARLAMGSNFPLARFTNTAAIGATVGGVALLTLAGGGLILSKKVNKADNPSAPEPKIRYNCTEQSFSYKKNTIRLSTTTFTHSPEENEGCYTVVNNLVTVYAKVERQYGSDRAFIPTVEKFSFTAADLRDDNYPETLAKEIRRYLIPILSDRLKGDLNLQ